MARHRTVRVGGSVDATIVQSTSYPFEEQIRFTVNVPVAVAFPLKLRIPGWASGASVLLNGAAQAGVTPGTFFTINRKSRSSSKRFSFPLRPFLPRVFPMDN